MDSHTTHRSELAEKALQALVSRFEYDTDFQVKHTGGLKFKVTVVRYHDLDRAPSYTSTETVLDGLNRIEAEELKRCLEAWQHA